jgi:hypothetical protein
MASECQTQGVTSLTPSPGATDLDSTLMEWMLQVVDELDDVVGALRHYALGLRAEIGLVVAGGVGAGALYAAIVTGAG